MKKVSCADRLKELRKDFGIPEDAYDGDEVTSISGEKPTLFFGKTKEVKKVRKALERQRTDTERQRVHKFLTEYCTDEMRQQIVNKYTCYNDLVEYCLQALTNIKKFWSAPAESMSFEDAFEENVEPVQQTNWEYDIPEYLLPQFEEYCKKHPIKGKLTFIARRADFLFKVAKSFKRAKKTDKSMRSLDPKTVRKNLEKVVEDHKLQEKDFREMVESLTGNMTFSEDLLKSFKAHTKRVEESVREKLEHLKKNETSVLIY